MYNNYKQAIAIIGEYEPQLEEFFRLEKYLPADIDAWHGQERAYLQKVMHVTTLDEERAAYVTALQTLNSLRAIYENQGPVSFRSYTNSDFVTGSLDRPTLTEAHDLEISRIKTHHDLIIAFSQVQQFELRLHVEQRWTPEDQEYRDAEDWMKHKQFIKVVEELEGRVVQRLFELSKANLAGTGYKLRRQISKNITRRSQALRTSLDKYNALAPHQNPPRPFIDYKEIANHAWLGDFDLLKYSRHDILSQPWANATNREIATKYHKVRRAREEIIRLNVEARRLQEWADVEDQELSRVANELLGTQPLLAQEIRAYAAVQLRVNTTHRVRLNRIYNLAGYTGPGIGTRGFYASGGTSTDAECSRISTTTEATSLNLDQDEATFQDDDDHLDDDLSRLEDVLNTIEL